MFLKTLAGAIAALALAACGPAGRDKIVNVEGDAFMGPADAKVTVIEYGSPTCPGRSCVPGPTSCSTASA